VKGFLQDEVGIPGKYVDVEVSDKVRNMRRKKKKKR